MTPAETAGVKLHKTPAAQGLPDLAALFALKSLIDKWKLLNLNMIQLNLGRIYNTIAFMRVNTHSQKTASLFFWHFL